MARGRGHLSSIELLGEGYDDIVAWAASELRERKRTQVEIHAEFLARLSARAEAIGDLDLQPISFSAFNRYATYLHKLGRDLERTREISSVLVDRLQPGETDAMTIVLASVIKGAVLKTLGEDDQPFDLKALKSAAEAVRAVAAAEKVSTDRRSRLEKEAAEVAARAAAAAASAVEDLAREAGLSAERVAQLKADVLGINRKPS